MNEETRGPGGLDSAYERRPGRRSPWGRRPLDGEAHQHGAPPGPPTYAALDLGTNNCRLQIGRAHV